MKTRHAVVAWIALVHAVCGCSGRGAAGSKATPEPRPMTLPGPDEAGGPDEPPRERELAVTCPGSDKGRCTRQEYCQWHDGTSTCMGEPKPVEDHETTRAVFECTRPLDCGAGNQCCTSPTQTWRRTHCATSCDLTNSTLVCETVADCEPRLFEVSPNMRHLAKLDCGRTLEDAGPTWLRLCLLEVP